MATQKDPRQYEAEDEDFLDREENYVMQKSTHMKMSRASAKNPLEPSHRHVVIKEESTRKTQQLAGAPGKTHTVGIVAQAVQRMEALGTLAPPPPPIPTKKQKHDLINKGKRSDSSDEDSLTMDEIFPQAFEKNGSSTESKSGNRSQSIYIPVVQQPWNEKSVMYLHASTLDATNGGTHYMKDLEFDDDDRSLDIVEVFPVLQKTTTLKVRRLQKPTSPPKQSTVAAVQAAAKRAETTVATEKAQIAVSHHSSDNKGSADSLRSCSPPVPQGLDELPKDSAKALERKKSKKLKKERSRKKSRKHIHEEDNSVEDEEARRERHRRKKEKKAKKKARENGEEKSRKKKKKHKKHSNSDSHLHRDGNGPVRRSKSMPDISDKEDVVKEDVVKEDVVKEEQVERIVNRAGLDDYIRDREASARQSMISIQSGQTTLVASNVSPRTTTSMHSEGLKTVKQSNVTKKEARAPRKVEEELIVDRSSFLSGQSKEKEPLSHSAHPSKTRTERKARDASLSDSARSRKADRKDADASLSDSARSRKKDNKAADDSLSDSARFRKARAEARKVGEDAKLASGELDARVKPLSPHSQTSPLPIKKRPPIRPPETRQKLKDSSQNSLDAVERMDSIGRFDVLTAVDSAAQTKKAEKRTSATNSVPPIAGTKKEKPRNIFKSIFSHKKKADGEGAEQSPQRWGLFGGSKQSKTGKQHTRSVPKHEEAQD